MNSLERLPHLTGMFMKVVVNGQLSEAYVNIIGVPQCSLHGPTPFLI